MIGTPNRAVSPIAAAVTAALYPGQHAVAQDSDPSAETGVLDQIVVTARKRSESAQDIPAAVQAISQESLKAMGAKGLEDYARFVPSINVVSYGPSSSTVVFRGAITGSGFISQSTSSVYLDEISVTQTGSQPSIRAVDIARVEALSGPQGSLYGSDAQAGTLRIITNQPLLDEFEAVFDGELRAGGDSDASYRGSLVFNVPLVEDRLAARIVGFKDHDGGFIDNVFGHTADWYGLEGTNKAATEWGTLDNADVVEERWNDADVYGGRLHLLWQLNDDWATTLSYHHQTTEAGADNYYDPYVGDLQVVRFHNEWQEETFDMASLRVDGDLGFAQLVAAVSFYERYSDSRQDVTTYAHYWAAQYCHDADPAYYSPADFPYYWTNPETGNIVWWPVYCQGPQVDADFFTASLGTSHDDKFTTEIRMSSTGDTLDWIVGFYHEDSTDASQSSFAAPSLGGDASTLTYPDSISANFWEWYYSSYYGTPVTYPNATAHWYTGSHTDWGQDAIFGEATWHISDSIDLTVGGRYFERSNTNWYFVNHPGGPDLAGEPDNTAGDREYRLAHGGNPLGRTGEENQFTPKVSLNYNLDDNRMVYALYSVGVRQGGVNRSRGEPFFPDSYESDVMDNYEVGYKSTFARGRGRLNLTAYKMKWSKYQLTVVDPSDKPCQDENGIPLPESEFSVPGVCGQPWQTMVANAGNAHIDGVNVEIDYAFREHWMLGLNYERIEAETDTQADLNGDGIDDLVRGLRLPLVPENKGSAWIEYRQPIELFGSNEFFLRTQWSFAGSTLNVLEPRDQSVPNPQFESDAYTIGDLRAGIVGDDWQVDLFVNNVTDERATYTVQSGAFEWAAAQTAEGRPHHLTRFTNRPLEFGVRYTKRWGD